MVGGGFAAAGVAAGPVSAQYIDDAWLKGPAKRPLAPGDIESAVQRLRKQFLAEFDPAYVENVIVPHFLVSVYDGEKPYLPMIGVELTKENAIPYDLWGCGRDLEARAREGRHRLSARVGDGAA